MASHQEHDVLGPVGLGYTEEHKEMEANDSPMAAEADRTTHF